MGALFVIIATVVADFYFYRCILAGQSIDAQIMGFILSVPFVTYFFLAVFTKVAEFIEYLLKDSLIADLYDDWVKSCEEKARKKKKERRNSVSWELYYRCETLLHVADAIRNSDIDSFIKCDSSFLEYRSNIKLYMGFDGARAAWYCDLLESFLIRNKQTVAQFPEGYAWLRSVGAI